MAERIVCIECYKLRAPNWIVFKNEVEEAPSASRGWDEDDTHEASEEASKQKSGDTHEDEALTAWEKVLAEAAEISRGLDEDDTHEASGEASKQKSCDTHEDDAWTACEKVRREAAEILSEAAFQKLFEKAWVGVQMEAAQDGELI